MGSHRPQPTPQTSCLPLWWWLLSYILFVLTVLALVALGVDPVLAIAAPATLSTAAILVVRWHRNNATDISPPGTIATVA